MKNIVWLQRVVLAALLVTVYLMVLAWNKDHPAKPTITQASSAKPSSTPQATASDVPALTATSNTDLPTATANVPAPVPAPAANTGATNNMAVGAQINVTTDVLSVQIDPRGGDVVGASLTQIYDTLQHKNSLRLLNQSSELTYVAQSGLIGLNGIDDKGERPLMQATAKQYSLGNAAQVLVPLKFTDANGVQITKTYTFTKGSYTIGVDYQISNPTAQPWQAQLFNQLKRDNSADPSSNNAGMGMATFLGAAWGTPEAPYNKIKLKNMGETPINQKVSDGYIAMVQHYFMSAWVPAKGASVQISDRKSGDYNIIGLLGEPFSVAPGTSHTLQSKLYVGPKDQAQLKTMAKGLDQTVDYGWLWPIAKPLHWALTWFHSWVGNWGWAIVLLTLLVKTLLYPLSAKSYRSMAKMKKIAPDLLTLKEKHGDDRAGFAQAMMALYKKEQVNPLSGCFPMLLQMPIFLALYWVLMESVELRHAPWLLWINDLSSLDKWFILPLLMGVTMYIQQQLNPQPADPMQAKMMKVLPVIFTVFLLFFPAGLVLYWVVNNIVSIAQQWYVTRAVEQEAGKA